MGAGGRNRQHHKKRMAGKQGEEEGWRAGNGLLWWLRAWPTQTRGEEARPRAGPRRTGGQCRFCWPVFFFCWAAFFLRSRHRLKADKHWQNFKNCCPSPADVHYVSGALRFTA